MRGVPIYEADTESFGNNGLGLLLPISCEVEAQGDQLFEATIEMPIDRDGKFRLLQTDRFLKIATPVAPAPETEEESEEEVVQPAQSAVQTVEIYRLRNGVSVNLRQKPSASSIIIDSYSNKAEVIVLQKTNSTWWKVQMKKGGAVGYMAQQYLVYVRTETKGGGGGSESPFVVPTIARMQIFRIYSVETNTTEKICVARALHYSYDLRGYIINREYKPEKAAAKTAIQTCWNALSSESPFTLYIGNVTGTITGDYSYRSFSDALLNEDDGLLKQCKARILRDNMDIYILPAESTDRGVTIRRGKNLKGVDVTVDVSEVVTQIIPCGKTADGDPLFLPEVFVTSPNAGNYAYNRVQKIDYDVQVDSEGDYPTTSAAYTALRTMAGKEFSENHIDEPIYGMDVDFVGIENLPEFQGTDFADLQSIFLHDTVAVIDELIGMEAYISATAYRWDALCEKYTRLTLGVLTDTGF